MSCVLARCHALRPRTRLPVRPLRFALLPAALLLASPWSSAQLALQRAAVGDAAKLERRFLEWRGAADAARAVRFGLAGPRGAAAAAVGAFGEALVEPAQGRVALRVRGLAAPAGDAWLLPFEDGEPLLLGRVLLADGAGSLEALLPSTARFELERIVLTPPGRGPEAAWIGGAPSLFQRAAARPAAIAGLPLGPPRAGAGAAVPPSARSFEELVDLGERLFFEETFDGNGRTCGTCHPAENNFTIDPTFIASLPPDDPLFVAETVPALDSARNGGLVFEVPVLLREKGLITVNADGFGDLARRYTLRGVPHLSGLARTILPAPGFQQPLRHLTGWGGDGAPGDGSLRSFAEGAVRQHFPRTLARAPGVDFRLPTALEQNALEAFQLSIGREAEPDLQTLRLKDAGAELGRNFFALPGTCSFCHQNGGANAALESIGKGNANFDTGVEAFTRARPDETGIPRPPDGGFGTNPDGGFDSLLAGADGSYGDRRFNFVSVIEVADTLPAFHSNVTATPAALPDTVEGAVRFYASTEFLERFPSFLLSEARIAQLGRFLRVLNALENLRGVEEYRVRAVTELGGPSPDLARAARIAHLAAGECADAIDVLAGVGLHPLARMQVEAARQHLLAARTGPAAARLDELKAAAPPIALAVEEMRH